MRSRLLSLFAVALLAIGCAGNQSIVTSVDEREANEIVVFLASKGIDAQKVQSVATGAAAAATTMSTFDITVDSSKSTEAMALLNQYGLPRVKGTNLLELFANTGLMTSDRAETVRYQSGLAEELSNIIRKIDGVIDADVEISFPTGEATPGGPPLKTTAAVYVKHQGVMEDPNSHMEVKIKRLLAGSVNGLNFDDVSVISDRSRFADISLEPSQEMIGGKNYQQTYVNIWSIVMTKSSLMRFRFIFFSLIILLMLLALGLGYLIYKFYPQILPKKKTEE